MFVFLYLLCSLPSSLNLKKLFRLKKDKARIRLKKDKARKEGKSGGMIYSLLTMCYSYDFLFYFSTVGNFSKNLAFTRPIDFQIPIISCLKVSIKSIVTQREEKQNDKIFLFCAYSIMIRGKK